MRKSFSIMFIVLLSLGLVCTRPFDIYADASDGEFDNYSVTGVQVEEYEELLSGVQGTRYRFNIILDGFYVGNFNIHVEYDSYNVSTSNWDHYNIDRTVYVCGYDTYFETWMRENWLPPSSITWSASVNNSDQCIYVGRMESQQLLNLLIGLRSSYNTNSAVEIGYLNQLDQKITQLLSYRQWHIPFESIPTVSYSLYKNYPIYELKNYNDYDIPMFTYTHNDILLEFVSSNLDQSGGKYKSFDVVIMFDRALSLANNNPPLHIEDGTWSNQNRINQWTIGDKTWVLATWTLSDFTMTMSGNNKNKITYNAGNTGLDLHGLILYFGPTVNRDYLSTDFAINFGYTNKLLNDLNIIVNGNQQTNNSSSNLEDMNDDYDDVSQQVFGLENNFSTGFDSSMQNVPTTFNFGTQFGNKFLATATWVRNQFDTMTTNTPFGALITFSLVLGLALLIVGRRLL